MMGPAGNQAPHARVSGSFLPLTRDESGRIRFDPDAGVIGMIRRAVTLPGDVVAGRFDVVPAVPGQWSEEDEARLQMANATALNRARDLAGLVTLRPAAGPRGAIGVGPTQPPRPPPPATAQSKPREIRRSELGDEIGKGGEKDVFEYGESQAVGVVKDKALARNPHRITEELAVLKQIRDVGIPVVDAQPVTVVGRPGMLMDRYEVGTKSIVRTIDKKVVQVGESPYLNERSASDLREIRRLMVENKVRIHDLQFLIGKDGRVVVSDPAKVIFGSGPSPINRDTIDLLIELASKKGPSK